MRRGIVRKIRDAVGGGALPEPFAPRDVNRVIGISYAGVLLPKHRVGGPRPLSEQHFERIERGRYTLRK